jgi:thymidine kinase
MGIYSTLENRSGSVGLIEVICGPMFSGKTEELIRRIRRAQIAKQKVQIFKPALDTRYSSNNVVSHSAVSIQAEPVKNANEILEKLFDSTRVVAIDEVQFFDAAIINVAIKLARRGLRVICGGLDCDYRGQPFGPMPTLLAIADDVSKIQAICTICGGPATKTYRKTDHEDQVVLGEMDVYEARCRAHWEYDQDEEFFFRPSTLLNTEMPSLAKN